MDDDDYDWAREAQEIAAAWKQPAFSRETIEADPWTAVHLPIPEDANRKLLEYARDWASDLQRYADAARENDKSQAAFGAPLDNPGAKLSSEENSHAATLRVEALGIMIGELAMRESSVDVANTARLAAADTAAEAHAVRIRDGEDGAEVAAWQPVRGFLSFLGAAANTAHTLVGAFLGTAENLASHAARAVDIALGAVIGYFVDEPKMTAAQVHQTLQAAGNVETIHAREVEAAAAVDAAEHETRMLAMKSEQQTHDLNLAMQLGTNATAEANIGLDAYEPQRRKQSQSL